MAKKAYLMAFGSDFGTIQTVRELVKVIPSILSWRYDLPNCIYLISESSAKELATEFRKLNLKGRFIITEIGINCHGWLSPDSWHVIQKKEIRPKT